MPMLPRMSTAPPIPEETLCLRTKLEITLHERRKILGVAGARGDSGVVMENSGKGFLSCGNRRAEFLENSGKFVLIFFPHQAEDFAEHALLLLHTLFQHLFAVFRYFHP